MEIRRELWIKLCSFPLAEPPLGMMGLIIGAAAAAVRGGGGVARLRLDRRSFDLMTEQVQEVRPPGRRGGDAASRCHRKYFSL